MDDDDSGITAFKNETGVKFPLVWDRNQSVSASYKPQKMPTSYIADQKGLIRDVHEGFHSGDDAEIERIVTAFALKSGDVSSRYARLSRGKKCGLSRRLHTG